MASAQERLKLKRPCEVWSVKEQLCLASSVLKSGDQNWMSVSRSLKPFLEKESQRPVDWFSQKACALQYAQLLENADTPKRKKRETSETIGESIVRRLTQERIDEISQFLSTQREEYQQLKNELNLLKSGNITDEKLQKMWLNIELEEREQEQKNKTHSTWLARRQKQEGQTPQILGFNIQRKSDSSESSGHDTLDPNTDEEEKKNKGGRSPLLTSLLKSPSPTTQIQTSSAQVTSPTIASLLGSSPKIPNPPLTQTVSSQLHQLVSTSIVNATPERPSAGAPTLSMLLELPANLQRATLSNLQPHTSNTANLPQQNVDLQLMQIDNQRSNIQIIEPPITPANMSTSEIIDHIDEVIPKDIMADVIDKDEINEIIGDIEELIKGEIPDNPQVLDSGTTNIIENLNHPQSQIITGSQEIKNTPETVSMTVSSASEMPLEVINSTTSKIAEIIGTVAVEPKVNTQEKKSENENKSNDKGAEESKNKKLLEPNDLTENEKNSESLDKTKSTEIEEQTVKIEDKNLPIRENEEPTKEEAKKSPSDEIKTIVKEDANKSPIEEMKTKEEVKSTKEEVAAKSTKEVKKNQQSTKEEIKKNTKEEEVKKNPKEEIKKNPKEETKNTKEEIKKISKDEVKKNPKEEVKKILKDDTKKNPKEEIKKISKEEIKKNPIEEVKKISKDDTKKKPIEEVKTVPKEEKISKEEAKKNPKEDIRKNSKEELKKTPKEEIKNKPKEELKKNPKEELIKNTKEEAKKNPKEEVTKKYPKEEVKKNPKEEVAKKNSKEEPKKNPKEEVKKNSKDEIKKTSKDETKKPNKVEIKKPIADETKKANESKKTDETKNTSEEEKKETNEHLKKEATKNPNEIVKEGKENTKLSIEKRENTPEESIKTENHSNDKSDSEKSEPNVSKTITDQNTSSTEIFNISSNDTLINEDTEKSQDISLILEEEETPGNQEKKKEIHSSTDKRISSPKENVIKQEKSDDDDEAQEKSKKLPDDIKLENFKRDDTKDSSDGTSNTELLEADMKDFDDDDDDEPTKIDDTGNKRKESKFDTLQIKKEEEIGIREENEIVDETIIDETIKCSSKEIKEEIDEKKVHLDDSIRKEQSHFSGNVSELDEEESSLSKLSGGRAMKTYSKRQAIAIDSEPEMESSEGADYRAWKKAVMLVYNRLATHKYASAFLRPITEDQAPGYHSIIFRPMDLSTIKKNIDNGTIRSTRHFQRDVMLMFQNAIMYNKHDTFVYKMAITMQEECLQHMQILVQVTGEVSFRRETRTAASTSNEASESSSKRKRSHITPSPHDTDNSRGKKRRKSEND